MLELILEGLKPDLNHLLISQAKPPPGPISGYKWVVPEQNWEGRHSSTLLYSTISMQIVS